jgi:hypothetical protein
MNHALRRTIVCAGLLCLTVPAFADVIQLPSNRNIDIKMSNDNGALYGSGPDDTYRIVADGGGLNQLHMTTDPAVFAGQVTTKTTSTSSAQGTFWITTTGGRGYNDDLILAFSYQGPLSSIPDDFQLKIKSSGYQWPALTGPASGVYQEGAVDETFTKADFLYGPQKAKPGPGNDWVLPFYSGQTIADNNTYLMFIDLYVGNDSVRSSIDGGSARVDFEISGISDTTVAFNAYAWANSANIGSQSINWTNNLSTNLAAQGQSGYSITAVPEPEQAALLAVGLSAIFLVLRRRRLS